jgi:ABC-type branched-subunit amino acid transport system substrate-binding protein
LPDHAGREAEKALGHLVNLGMTKIALVVADDSFGQDAKKGAVRGFERAKLQPVLDLKVDRQKPDYAAMIPALQKSEVERMAKSPANGKVTMRPWLQDFSMGTPSYTAADVRAQIQACYDLGVDQWILWNAANRYTRDALQPET